MDNIKLDLIRNASSHRATIQDSIYLLGPIISITSTVLGKLKYEQWSVTAINNKESKVKKNLGKVQCLYITDLVLKKKDSGSSKQ